MKKGQKDQAKYCSVSGFAHAFILAAVVLIGIAGIGYFAFQNGQIKINREETLPTAANSSTVQLTTTLSPDEGIISEGSTTGWSKYTNTSKGYFVQFPSDIYKRKPCVGEELLLVLKDEMLTTEYSECGRDSLYTIEFRTYFAGETMPDGLIESTNPVRQNYIDLVNKFTTTTKKTYKLSGLVVTDYIQIKREVVEKDDTADMEYIEYLKHLKEKEDETNFYESLSEWRREVYIRGNNFVIVVLSLDKGNNEILDKILSTFEFLE